jgi:hypothetical protein
LPLIVGGATRAGMGGATTVVGGDVAERDPAAFVAVTRTRSVMPMSSEPI